jgi:hypothetical protein
MRVSKVIETLQKLLPDSEIAIDWVTKDLAEQEINRILTDWEWDTAVEEWELTDFDDETYPVSAQVCAVVESRAEVAAQNRDYYRDVLGVK